MNESTAAATRIVAVVHKAFPDDAVAVDNKVRGQGFDPAESPHFWVEHFSQCTTDAIKAGDMAKAAMHLDLFSRLLTHADDATIRCIDVSYVESLLWDVKDDKVKRAGWKLVPANLRKLYVAMWGERPFMTKPGGARKAKR